jgi:hypothetical protein
MASVFDNSSSYLIKWTSNQQQNKARAEWLESIIRNAAPSTDWWIKARIIQLALPAIPEISKSARGHYKALLNETVIIKEIEKEIEDFNLPISDYFQAKVTPKYVQEVLKAWTDETIFQQIGRNFEIYQYKDLEPKHKNIFLVTSTASTSLEVDRVLPDLHKFTPLFNVDEFAKFISDSKSLGREAIERLTIRTHGYSNPAAGFYQRFIAEAEKLKTSLDPDIKPLLGTNLYIGYYWPSEQPFSTPTFLKEYWQNLKVFVKFIASMAVLSLLGGLLAWIGSWAYHSINSSWPSSILFWIVTIFSIWIAALFLLRAVVYQRDRYRAIHYGSPDLSEFFWRLDKALNGQFKESRIKVSMIGHSMGALMLVNTLRILSERFGKDDQQQISREESAEIDNGDAIGDNFTLIQLIFASPDIPLEFIQEGRNNYIRSAMNRCSRVYLFSSDRDIVLRYLANLGNWFSEPSIKMAGLRLGNVYLHRNKRDNDSHTLLIRIFFQGVPAIKPISARDLFWKFNYLDCSMMRGDSGQGGVNGIDLPLYFWSGPLIDLINTLIYLSSYLRLPGLSANQSTDESKVDLHGGYFQPNTLSFKILHFLITNEKPGEAAVNQQIEKMVANQSILFVPGPKL